MKVLLGSLLWVWQCLSQSKWHFLSIVSNQVGFINIAISAVDPAPT
jgi:hypothetical protein